MRIETLRARARRCLEFSGRSARERDFHQNFEDAPRGSAIFLKIFRTLRARANFQDAPHGSAILIIREPYGADQFSRELV